MNSNSQNRATSDKNQTDSLSRHSIRFIYRRKYTYVRHVRSKNDRKRDQEIARIRSTSLHEGVNSSSGRLELGVRARLMQNRAGSGLE